MIDRIKVSNFQSLRQADLRLGRFTVIVGQTSSGKSALVRALRMVTSNARGNAFVSRGQRMASVSLYMDGSVLTIERGEGHGRYRLAVAGQPEQVFTKLNGDVPDPVSQWLRLWPGERGALNIAAQFDPPFLLADSGAVVARELGELTHVTVLLEAAREANRRRLASAATLKVRQADLTSLAAQVQTYAGLSERLVIVEHAEDRLVRAQELAARIDRLRSLVRQYDQPARPRPPALPCLPDVAATHQRCRRLAALLQSWEQHLTDAHGAQARLQGAVEQERAAHEALHSLLETTGYCPTCQRPWKAEHD